MSEKLQKILAAHGLGPRREMEQWISAGRITVNGKIAQLGDRVDEMAQLAVDGGTLLSSRVRTSKPVLLLYHKPVGEICTAADPEGRPTVFDRLPKPPSGRWVMVGRLDYNTSGLLLFTNDGELAHKLMHPSSAHQRVYAVRLLGNLSKELSRKLCQGVVLSDGLAHFASIEPMKQEGMHQWYRVSISMGRNRIVRRLFESQGFQVNRLVRLSFGTIKLPKDLAPGEFSFSHRKITWEKEK
jgi:23S rRNA pseudouridine2605 synthase